MDEMCLLAGLSCSSGHPVRYISNIEMPGGKIVYVPLHPPKDGPTTTSSAANWAIDFDELEKAITPKTKMIVLNTPRKSPVKVYILPHTDGCNARQPGW